MKKWQSTSLYLDVTLIIWCGMAACSRQDSSLISLKKQIDENKNIIKYLEDLIKCMQAYKKSIISLEKKTIYQNQLLHK